MEMTKPRTEAGRDANSATFHSPTCDKSALMDGVCTCGWTRLILAIEAEAVKPWREALQEAVWEAHAYGLISQHGDNNHQPETFVICTYYVCKQARVLLAEDDG